MHHRVPAFLKMLVRHSNGGASAGGLIEKMGGGGGSPARTLGTARIVCRFLPLRNTSLDLVVRTTRTHSNSRIAIIFSSSPHRLWPHEQCSASSPEGFLRRVKSAKWLKEHNRNISNGCQAGRGYSKAGFASSHTLVPAFLPAPKRPHTVLLSAVHRSPPRMTATPNSAGTSPIRCPI